MANPTEFENFLSENGALADRRIEPLWHTIKRRMQLKRGMQTVKDLEHQRLRGIDAETWDRVPDLFGEIDLFDGTSMELPPTLCE